MSAYETVTAQIIEKMQTVGTGWLNPMQGSGMPANAITGNRYSGINVLILGLSGKSWATYKQWQSVGAQVKKGEKGTSIVFFKPLKIEDKATGKDKTIPLLKSFTVFSADQVEGYESTEIIKTHAERIASAELWVENSGADIRFNDANGAFYKHIADYIQLPTIEAFKASPTSTQTENYYSTLLHELTHWTGHSSRNDRLKATTFGSKDYAFEELVAELGAAFQCALLGITSEPREDHAQYLNSWIRCLQDDKRAIFKAAALAEKAVKYLEALQTSNVMAA